MNAFYLINKPLWITSYDVIRDLKKQLQTRRMGHSGTLDPLASGLLLIAVWSYTKLLPYITDKTKSYNFEGTFNGVTESYDLGTEIEFCDPSLVENADKNFSKEKLEEILKKEFTGLVTQVPPKYSAVKIWGKKALLKMKDGEDFEVPSRKVEIFDIHVLEYDFPKISFEAFVAAGTYVRSIVYDLGQIFWTGGYVTKLDRHIIGKLSKESAQELDNLDTEKKVDLHDLFYYYTFIRLRVFELAALNDGKNFPCREELGKFDEDQILFVENSAREITHIVRYREGRLFAVKKV